MASSTSNKSQRLRRGRFTAPPSRPIVLMLSIRIGATHLHPGYGYLSESAALRSALDAIGVTFVGPNASILEACGDKLATRQLAEGSHVPVVPGTSTASPSDVATFAGAHDVGYPIMLKAVDGGGGRGIRLVSRSDEVETAWKRCQGESPSKRVFAEKALTDLNGERWKHIEVQIVGDASGNVTHLWERECSVQRRYQKVVEMAPSTLPREWIQEIIESAIAFAKDLGYVGVGTFEFLAEPGSRRFYFLEINPRIQVEHTVTESITGVDLVDTQLRIAQGASLSSLGLGSPPPPTSFAIQARLTAEDPHAGFSLSTGTINHVQWPTGSNVRVDTWLRRPTHSSSPSTFRVTPYFDSLLGKVIVSGPSLPLASTRLVRALEDTSVVGVETNLQVLKEIVKSRTWVEGKCWTGWLEGEEGRAIVEAAKKAPKPTAPSPVEASSSSGTMLLQPNTTFTFSLAGSPSSPRPISTSLTLTSISSNNFPSNLSGLVALSSGEPTEFTLSQDRGPGAGRNAERGDPHDPGHVIFPLDGQLVGLSPALKEEGKVVKKGQELAVLTMMKMETPVVCPFDAKVRRVGGGVKEGEMMVKGGLLCVLERVHATPSSRL